MARLAISKGFLADYAKLDKQVQRTVDQAIAAFARRQDPGQHLEIPKQATDDRLRLIPLDGDWRGVVIAPDDATETYCLVTVLTQDRAAAYLTTYGRPLTPLPGPAQEPPHPDPQNIVLPTPATPIPLTDLLPTPSQAPPQAPTPDPTPNATRPTVTRPATTRPTATGPAADHTQPLPEPPLESGPSAPSPPPGRMTRLARRLHLRRPARTPQGPLRPPG